MSISRIIYIVVFVTVFAMFPLYGSAGVSHEILSGDTFKIEEVTVHNERPLSETGILKTRIDSLVMEEKIIRSLSEVLSEHSPVFIKTYGRGSMSTASFRGTAPSHTRVTWNGIEINSPMLGMVDFSLIPVYFADDISLIHGSGTLQETPGAIGGIISLSTRPDWTGKFSGRYIQGTGSYGSWDHFLSIRAGNSKIQPGTRVFHSRSNNDFRYVNRDIIDSVDMETGEKFFPVSTNLNAGYSQYGLLQELYLRPGNNNLLKFSLWGQRANRGIPHLASNESGSAGGKSRQNDDVLRMTGSWKRYSGKLIFEYLSGINIQDLGYRFGNEIQGFGNINLLQSFTRSFSWVNRAEAEYKLNSSDVIRVKTVLTNDMVNSHESVTGMGYDKRRNQGSLLIAWSHRVGERLRTGICIGEEISGRELSPLLYNISGEYHLTDRERLFIRAGISRNVKFPGMNDLYHQPGGNPGLNMETAFNREAGIFWTSVHKACRFEMNINGYFNDVRNWILWLPTFKGYWEPRNISRVKISGIESSAVLNFHSKKTNYKIRVDYAYTSSKNASELSYTGDISSGKQLPFIPLNSANALFNTSRNGWSLTWIWNYFSERYINTSNNYHSSRDYLYPYYMNQLSAGKSFSANKYRSEISITVHNIFNEEYRSILQRPMPGRNLSIMVKIGF